MSGHTITELIRRVRTYERQKELLSAWACRWQAEQMDLIDRLYKAENRDDHDQITILTGQLRGMSEKRFPTLRRLFNEVSRPDHRLISLEEEKNKDRTDAVGSDHENGR